MAIYTGTTQAKPGVGKKIWLAVVAFAVAAALVIALVAMQGGSTAPGSSGTGQTQSQLSGASTGGGSGKVGTGGGLGKDQAIQHTKQVCSQCAP